MQNVPNILSLSRILATVVILVLVLINTPLGISYCNDIIYPCLRNRFS